MTNRCCIGYVLALLSGVASANEEGTARDRTPSLVETEPGRPVHERTLIGVSDQPERRRIYDRWNAPVFATGALIFAGSYGASTLIAGRSDNPAADRLLVPVVGPWMALGAWGDCPIEEPRCDKTTTDKVLLVADGVFQAAGVLTMLSGLVSPSLHTVSPDRRTVDDRKLRLRPTRNGFVFTGTF